MRASNTTPRASAWIGAARGRASAYYVVEIGRLDERDEWRSDTLEGACDGDVVDAAREGLLAALATLEAPSRVGVAVTDPLVARDLRRLVRATAATEPHIVSVTCVSATAIYAAAAVECAQRAKELSAEDGP